MPQSFSVEQQSMLQPCCSVLLHASPRNQLLVFHDFSGIVPSGPLASSPSCSDKRGVLQNTDLIPGWTQSWLALNGIFLMVSFTLGRSL